MADITQRKKQQDKPKVYYDTYGREFNLPDFSIKEIYEAIPAHCFERSTIRSLSYVVRDLFLVACAGYAATYIHTLPSLPLRVAAWLTYAVVQGCFGTGLWILAHECGHSAFSPSKKVNDTVGFVLHSALLVPYFSWKFSHARHHQMTGHLQKDMVFVPRTRNSKIEAKGAKPEDYPFMELMEETPIATAWALFLQQVGGWPAYLFKNVTGQPYPEHSTAAINHFWPFSPLFKSEQRVEIALSDLGLAFTSLCLYLAYNKFGLAAVILYYVLPYLIVNNNLVMITFLQHTDPALPHYREGEWNYARGASATIDREFGFVGRHLFHGIIETHVCHHLIARIPFYNADEATVHIKKVMGDHYQRDDTNFFVSLFRAMRTCQFVADEGDVVFYQNAHGLGHNADGHLNRVK
ncbi:fatty acid desaturase-domain-containing protein [Protomyces lactucae-debilis]|uniref:Fatty acid desaturase-domain-containing protein n=1 Tax=Protomyces lactucae-debilis TaxID=2754530 RepID=A0A1Y2FJV6_PROLT|nr:fatty acid desaturase-domain-containing protein [Protomyces lactucae-debilis]ORY84219.1 fatty acid desaturase-domain-containing protein [Protomyces lactucae-debilis]